MSTIRVKIIWLDWEVNNINIEEITVNKTHDGFVLINNYDWIEIC